MTTHPAQAYTSLGDHLALLTGGGGHRYAGAGHNLTLDALQDKFRTAEAVVPVSAGDHRLEIQQQHDGGKWTGVEFTILAPDVPDYAPEFSPY